MKKKYDIPFHVGLKKIMRIMRITAVIVFLLSMHVYADSFGQVEKINLKMKANIREVFDELEKVSGYRFILKSDQGILDKQVDVNNSNEKIDKVLDNLLYDTGYTYKVIDRYIAIIPIKELNTSFQQQKFVSGKVTDSSRLSLPGVTVLVKGTTTGVITDSDGKFLLSNVPDNATLVFSFVGMKTQEIPVSGKNSINVTMSEETIGIEEVVAVGYGTQTKASLTGAISSVKAEDLISTKSGDVTNMLAGKMSGVRIVQRTGEPGDFASSIQIRGFGTPLIIIDGVPRDNMPKLNPNEIESMSVLKDASASIYGVRAANGVVLITTKKGKGKMKLEYSGYYGVQTPINTPRGLDAVQFMEITNENNIMRGSVAPGTLVYSQDEIDSYKNGVKTGTDWSRVNSNYYAPQYQHNISASGGTEKIDYFVNFGNFSQEGIYKSGDLNYERYNFRSNVSSNIYKNLKVELLVNGMVDTKNSPFGADNREQYWASVWSLKPTEPAYANYTREYPQSFPPQGNTPIVKTISDIIGNDRASQRQIQTTGNLIWDIPWIKGLQAKGSFSYDYNFWEKKSLEKTFTLYQYDLGSNEYIPKSFGNINMPGTSKIIRSTQFGANTLLHGSLNFNRNFTEKHHVSALLLYEEGTSDNDNFYAQRYITMTSIEELFGGVDKDQVGSMNSGGLWKTATKALVGRLNYNFDDRYYTEFAFRYDGSSKFATGHQWGFFPSISAGWRISEESFMKNNSSLSFINNLKIRASYGVTGDDRTANFQYVSGYTYPIQAFYWPVRFFGNQRAAGIQLKNTPNPYLTWMTSNILDIGLDAELWQGLLGFEFDVYKRNRDGLVGSRAVNLPDWLGEGLAQENLNSDATSGLDITLKHRNSINTSFGKLAYGISANVGITRTKNVYVERTADLDQYGNWRNDPTNRPNDIWWGYGADGQFQNYDEIFSYAILDGNGNSYMKPGDYKLQDWNEDGVIDNWDVHPLANGANTQNTPRIFFGSTINIEFIGFDVIAILQGGAMSRVRYTDRLATPFVFDANGADIFYDRWHMENPLNDPKDPRTKWIPGYYPTISQGSPSANINFGANSETIKRADYIRLKSIELGYTIPKPITDKIGIQDIRIFANAYNLVTLTKLKYLDPEHPSSNNGLLYPLIRTINFGGSINF